MKLRLYKGDGDATVCLDLGSGVKGSIRGTDLVASEISFFACCGCWQQIACLSLLLMHWGTADQPHGAKVTTTPRSTESKET